MSTLGETIQHTQAAVATCEELTSLLAHGAEIVSRLEQSIRAAVDGTGHSEVAGQYHQAINATVSDGLQAAIRLRDYLEGLIAQFQTAR